MLMSCHLLIDGLNASPLKSTSGLLADNWETAVQKRAAPPTGSWLRPSMLYTSLK